MCWCHHQKVPVADGLLLSLIETWHFELEPEKKTWKLVKTELKLTLLEVDSCVIAQSQFPRTFLVQPHAQQITVVNSGSCQVSTEASLSVQKWNKAQMMINLNVLSDSQ